MIKLPTFDQKTLKIATATMIVAAAAIIVIPVILGVVFALLKIGLIIVIAGGACLAIAYGRQKLLRISSTPPKVLSISTTADSTGATAAGSSASVAGTPEEATDAK